MLYNREHEVTIMPDDVKQIRKNPRPRPRSFYLGNTKVADQRLEKIDEIAERFGLTRSTLLQAIADGELIVVKPGEKP